MSKAGLDNRHRNKDGEISGIRTLRKLYGRSFAAGYPETEKLSEVLPQLNETSLSQLRRDAGLPIVTFKVPTPSTPHSILSPGDSAAAPAGVPVTMISPARWSGRAKLRCADAGRRIAAGRARRSAYRKGAESS